MNETDVTAGIDIGGTNTTVGIVNPAGRIVGIATFPTDTPGGADHFVARLAMVIEDECKAGTPGWTLRGVGVASPAANFRDGTIQRPANLMWGTINIVRMLKQYFDLPVTIVNDSNAAALGEMHYGLAKKMKNFLVITLGTGLGAGIVAGGQLLQGENGVAGELGHMTIDPQGRECGCGRRGCVETYVSASGVRRTAIELLGCRTGRSAMRSISFNDLTSKRISELAEDGDMIAREAFEITGHHMGRVLADVAALFDPEAIILTGGLTNAGEFLLAPTRKAFEDSVLGIHKGRASILISEMRDGHAAVLGASSVVRASLHEGVVT